MLIMILLVISCKNDPVGPNNKIQLGASMGGTQMRWVRSAPLEIAISDAFTDPEAALIEEMMTAWDTPLTSWQAFTLPTSVTPNIDTGSLESYRDQSVGIYLATNWPASLGSDTLAVTQYFGFTRNSGAYIEITQADIIVNNFDFSYSITDDPFPAEYDLPSVVLHELGHLLGLRHNSNSLSVMAPYIFGGTLERTLYDIDKSNIHLNYSQFGVAPLQGKALSFDTASDEPIHGVIELRRDGSCHHFENKKLVSKHYGFH